MGARERLEVLGQTPAAPQPAERAFDNPTLLEHHKALGGIRALHDLELGPRRSAHRPGCSLALLEESAITRSRKGKSRRTWLKIPRQPSRSCTLPGRMAQPSIRPSVSTTAWRLRPLTFLAAS